MDDLLARHKKEQRDLVATTTSLKKQASKKTRKAVNQKCLDMQAQLDAKHKHELQELTGEAPDEPADSEVTPEQLLATMLLGSPAPLPIPEQSGPPSNLAAQPRKRNRAKEKLAKRKAEEDAVRLQAQQEAANTVDYRQIENELMQRLLAGQNLELFEIQPDGHCLFRSLEDQLRLRHLLDAVLVPELRKQAAEYIQTHADDFTPYLFDETTCSVRDVAEYTAELEGTAMWGSDMELLALSRVYNCPIKVLVAGSAPIVFNEEGHEPTLIVAYHKHSYGLGEHYNSCRDRVEGV